MDVFDYMKADVSISGTVPTISHGAKIKVEDYHQQFSRAGHGFITSKTEHMFSVEGSDKLVTFTVDQSIRWDECSGSQGLHLTRSSSATMRLHSERNFIVYDKNQQVVRYASTSKITPLSSSEDPCSNVDCGEAGVCLVSGSSHICSCLPGHQLDDQNENCQDIDECQNLNVCHSDATCLNTPGSYECYCKEGFIGNGKECLGRLLVCILTNIKLHVISLEEKTCEELSCSENADCITNKLGQGQCSCRRGYRGDGINCFIIPSDGRLKLSNIHILWVLNKIFVLSHT